MHLTNYSVNKQLRTYHFRHAVPFAFFIVPGTQLSFKIWTGKERRRVRKWCDLARNAFCHPCGSSGQGRCSCWWQWTTQSLKMECALMLPSFYWTLNTEYHALMRLIDAEFPCTRGQKVILQSAKVSKWTSVPDSVQKPSDSARHGTSIGDRIQKPIQDSFRKGRPGLWGVGLRKSGHTEILLCTLHMESFSKQQAWGNVGRNEGAGASLASCCNNLPENEGCDCVQDLVIKTLIAVEEPLQAALDLLISFPSLRFRIVIRCSLPGRVVQDFGRWGVHFAVVGSRAAETALIVCHLAMEDGGWSARGPAGSAWQYGGGISR